MNRALPVTRAFLAEVRAAAKAALVDERGRKVRGVKVSVGRGDTADDGRVRDCVVVTFQDTDGFGVDEGIDTRFYWFAVDRCGDAWECTEGDAIEYRLWEEADDE